MNFASYFRDLFESIEDYRKIVLLLFAIQNGKNLLYGIGFSERDVNHLKLKLEKISIEQHEEYLDYIKNEEESTIEKILNKLLQNDFNHLNVLSTILNK